MIEQTKRPMTVEEAHAAQVKEAENLIIEHVQNLAGHLEQLRQRMVSNLVTFTEDVSGVVRWGADGVVVFERRVRELRHVLPRLSGKTTFTDLREAVDALDRQLTRDFVRGWKPIQNGGLAGLVEEMNRLADQTIILFDLERFRAIVNEAERQIPALLSESSSTFVKDEQ